MAIDFEAVERTVRQHGILLEHQVRDRLSQLIRADGNRKGQVRRADVSAMLPCHHHPEDEAIEIDVLLESFHSTCLGQLAVEVGGEEPYPVYNFQIDPANLHSTWVVQCKGHARDGFLIVRERPSMEDQFRVPFRLSATQFSDGKRKLDTTPWFPWAPNWRKPTCAYVDWGYFYQPGMRNGIYSQDRDGAFNKFMGAVEQLNYSVGAAIDGLGAPLIPPKEVHHIVPMVVTNCPIILMRVSDEEVELKEQIPWVLYRNHFRKKFYGVPHKVLEYFYVVHLDELEPFYGALMDVLSPLAYPSPAPVARRFTL